MADQKKILTTIIKRLDRVIALLENCYDTDNMSESTSRRLVEMLHTSISDIYSFRSQDDEDIVVDNNIPTTTDILPKIEEISEDVISEEITHEDTPTEIIEKTEYTPEPVDINEEAIITEPFIQETAVEDEQPVVVEEHIADDLIELESPSAIDYMGNTTEEQFEVAGKETTIAEPQENEISQVIKEEEEKLAKEKAQLAELRNQLEEERKRLEEELVSWQKERLKREEEIKASEQLLAALEAETQKRKAVINEPLVTPVITPPVVEQAPPKPVVQAQPAEPKKTIADVNSNGATTIGDRLSEQRQSMQDQASSDELKRQGITPIPDLTRAIGINDKFQFIKELFGGDSDRYNDTIRMLNNFNGLGEAYNHINNNFKWDKNSEVVKRFVLLIRRRYML